jgi:subtilase family serine protease
MRGAYGVPSISFSGTAGTGAGETIAILDPGDDTALVNSTAPNFSTSDLGIFDSYYGIAAIDAAASSMHIGILSMSFGGAESQFGSTAEEEAYDAYYFDNPGLVYCASTGDFGAYEEGGATIGANFPASSSNVLAVGGTTLSVSGNNYSSETTLGERN